MTSAYALSPLQERLFRDRQEQRGGPCTWLVLKVEGSFDFEQLQGALERVVGGHEILRTRFRHSRSGKVAQVIEESLSPRVEIREWHDRAAASALRPPEELLQADRDFDPLSRDGAVIGLTWIRGTGGSGWLHLTTPTVNSDLVGLLNVIEAMTTDAGVLVPTVPDLQYADIAQWLWEVEKSPDTQQVSFEDFAVRAVPDHESTSFESSHPRRSISVETDSLRRLALRHEVSLAATTLAAWKLLLLRLDSRQEATLAVRQAGRQLEDVKPLPGLFDRYVGVGGRYRPAESFIDWVAEIDRKLAAASENRLPRSGEIACVAAFDFHRLGQRFRFGNALLQAVAGDCELDYPQLRLVVAQVDERVEAQIVADPRIDTPHVERIAERFGAICKRLEQQARDPMRRVDFLLPAERQRLLIGINDTERTFPTERSVLSLIREQVTRCPGAPAIEWGSRVLSYQELEARAAALATTLKRRGLGEDDRIGIFLERSIDLIVAVMGVLQSGAAYVPLDPAYPRDRLQAMCEDAAVSAVITREALLKRLPGGIAEQIIAPDWQSPISEYREVSRFRLPEPEALAYVIFTSGSTGRPKGVAITHRGLALSNLARIEAYGEPVDRFLLLSSFSFDSSLVGIFWTLCTGGCLVLIDEDMQKDPEQVVRVVREAGITHLLTLPTYWSFVLDSDAATSMKSLKIAIVAGEACPSVVVEKHRRLLPKAQLFSEYGATETSIFATLYRCDEIAFPTVPLGRPVANARLYLLDSELQPVPPGAVGEVYFGGRVISPGYYGRPDLTAERFLPDPFSAEPGARMYRSGDLGRYTESGELIFRGRSDQQVKIRGYRVELEEIESGLLRHPSIRRAAVVAYRPSEIDCRRVAAPDAGLDALRLAGFFETSDDVEPERETLSKFLRGALPSYMVPGHLVRVARLPTTPTGKVDRNRLLPLLPKVSGDDEPSSRTTSPEEILLQLWREVLGNEAIGIEDNYFDLGGDSILSLAIVARAREVGLRLSPVDIFQFSTVRELAQRLEVASSPEPAGEPVSGSVPLTPIQHWFTELEIPNPNHWNMPLWVEVPRRLGVEELSRALVALVDHHAALRLRLTRDGERWHQEIVASEPPPIIERFEIEDPFVLSEIGERIGRPDFTREGIDLQSGPLSRCWLFALPGERSVLFWNAHHAALDLVSWGILLRDLDRALHQVADGEAVHLPEKSSSFRAWATALEREAASKALRRERDFWLSMLAQPDDRLPIERGDRGSNRESSARIETAELTIDETSGLMRREGARVGDAVLTSLVCVLTQWSDNPAVTIELENHGRSEVLGMDLDISRTVGWFTASHPARFESASAQGVQAVEETRKRRESVPRNGIGWGLLRYLVRDEEIRAIMLPEVLFSYLGHANFAATRQFQVLGGDLYYPSTRDPQAKRPHLLEVGAWIVDGKLRLTWRFSEELYHRSTIRALIQNQRRWLQDWARHSGESTHHELGSPYGWDTATMSKIAAAIERSRKRS